MGPPISYFIPRIDMGSDWIFVYDVHEDIISNIFTFLSHRDLYSLMRASYTLNKIASNELIWKEQYNLSRFYKYYPVPSPPPKFFQFKKFYRDCYLQYAKAISVYNDLTVGPKATLMELSKQNLVQSDPFTQSAFMKDHAKYLLKEKTLKILNDVYLKEIPKNYIRQFSMKKKQVASCVLEISDHVGFAFFRAKFKDLFFEEYCKQNNITDVKGTAVEMNKFISNFGNSIGSLK
jgi:hypothetical protein